MTNRFNDAEIDRAREAIQRKRAAFHDEVFQLTRRKQLTNDIKQYQLQRQLTFFPTFPEQE